MRVKRNFWKGVGFGRTCVSRAFVTALHTSRRYFSLYLGNRVAKEDSSVSVPPLLSDGVNGSIFHWGIRRPGQVCVRLLRHGLHYERRTLISSCLYLGRENEQAYWSISSVSQAAVSAKSSQSNVQPRILGEKLTFIFSMRLILLHDVFSSV